MDRRNFLKISTIATKGVLLPISVVPSAQQTKRNNCPWCMLCRFKTAWELVKAGHEVIVVEARNR